MNSYAWRFCRKCHVPIIPVRDWLSVDGLRKKMRTFKCNKCGKTYDFEVGYLDLLGDKVEYVIAFENLYRKIPAYMVAENSFLELKSSLKKPLMDC